MCLMKEILKFSLFIFFQHKVALKCFHYFFFGGLPGASAMAQPKPGKFSNRCSPSAIIMEVRVTICSSFQTY